MRVRNYNCSVNQLQQMTASDPGVFSEISFDILQDFVRNCSAVGEANNLMLHFEQNCSAVGEVDNLMLHFDQNCSAVGEADNLMLHLVDLNSPQKDGSGVGRHEWDYMMRQKDVFGGYKLMDVPKKYHQNSVGERIGGVTEAEEYIYIQ